MSLGVGKCMPWVDEKGLLPGRGPCLFEKSCGVGVEGKVGARNRGEEGAEGLGEGEAETSGFLSFASPASLGASCAKGFLTKLF